MSGQCPPKRRCLEPKEDPIEVHISHLDDMKLESVDAVLWTEDQTIAAEHNYCSKLMADCATQTYPALSVSVHNMDDNDSKYFTGIGVHCFWQLLYAVVALLPPQRDMTLTHHDQLLLVLMRLRLGLMFSDLGKRFAISKSTAYEIFSLWRPVLAKLMRENVITWLPRETVKKVRPQIFSEHYPHATCIVDCTEIFVQSPTNFKNSTQLNPYKVLYCVAPNGYVMFVSKLFGGEASDACITKDSGFADHLIPGDQIVAGHGFPNTHVLPPGVTVAPPAFTQDGKKPLEHEVTETHHFTKVNIHIERALNRLKGFKVLRNVILGNVKHVDDILSICAGLCNLQP